jgi:hypothetical protein
MPKPAIRRGRFPSWCRCRPAAPPISSRARSGPSCTTRWDSLAAPELRDTFAKQGADAAGGSPDEFAAFMREEQARWGVVVREAGIKAD